MSTYGRAQDAVIAVLEAWGVDYRAKSEAWDGGKEDLCNVLVDTLGRIFDPYRQPADPGDASDG